MGHWWSASDGGAKAGLEAGMAARRLYATILENQAAAPGVATQSRPNLDPQQQSAAARFSLDVQPRLVIGTITDSTAIANCYRVQFEKFRSPLTACLLSHSSLSAYGPRDLTTLQPGQAVLTLIHEQLPYAIILGVLPSPDVSAQDAIATVLLASTRQRVDEAHKTPLRTHGAGNINSWLCGRPADLTTGGEVGWITETGIRIALDSFLAQLAVDESCGIFAFLHDQLLRVAGQNLQLWTAGMEREGLLDGAEYNDVTGITPYPWEQLGLFEPGDPRRELAAEDWQIKQPYYSKWEPKDDKQMAWHRVREFYGYLGQGGKHSVQARAIDVQNSATYEGGGGAVGAEHPLLFDSWTGLNGYHTLASAAGISIVKRLGLVSPVRLRRPEDADGDTDTNYKFGGQVGSGPAHAITTEPKAEAEDASLQRIAGLLDLHAYLFNYAGVHPFHWHGKDWGLAQESELEWTEGKSLHGDAFKYGDLASKMILPPPKPLKIKVDHRYGEQDYYQTESGIDFLPDGSVVLFDGWGSELVMSGGSIAARCAGDIWHQAGRNVNVWAGFDAITRAKNGVDITATEKDVRIKAERNLQVIAGNGGEGGMLFDSRAEESTYDFENFGEDANYSGIIFKAANTECIAWAKNIYLRTGGGDVAEGVITIDAAKGAQSISLHAANVNQYVANGVFILFGQQGDVSKATGFTQDSSAICSQTFIGGQLTAGGSIIARGDVLVAGGHIRTEEAPSFEGFVDTLSGNSLGTAYDSLTSGDTAVNNDLPKIGKDFFSKTLKPSWYDNNRPGSDEVMEKGSFSLRSLAQYKTDDFKLYESRWQQMSRLAGQSVSSWEEKSVSTRGQEFFPYPGKENFKENKFFQQDLSLFEPTSGNAKGRGNSEELASEYASPQYKDPQATTLNQYLVIR